MLVTENSEWAKKARYLTTQAKDDPNEYVHHEVGYNYRMTNIQAAFGCAQIEALGRYVERRRQIRSLYETHLNHVPGLSFQEEAKNTVSNCWLTTIYINPLKFGVNARNLRTTLKDHRIEARPLWQPAHLSPAHQDAVKLPCPVSEDLYQNCLSIPSSSSSSDNDIYRVIDVIQKASLSRL
jgi:perosamine synthetase